MSSPESPDSVPAPGAGGPASARYDDFLEARAALDAQLAEVVALARSLGAEGRAAAIAQARERLGSDAFRLLVLGEFKRGKSTLVNALLGDRVLPARVAPCTGLITVVRYGAAPRAVLVPRDQAAAPREIAVDEIADHITIQDDLVALGDGAEEAPPAASPWDRVELDFPLELCRNNVELVDSPGLNEHLSRERITLGDLPRADAVLMVLSCEQQLARTERDFVHTHLGTADLAHAFFVWNRFDAVRDDPDEVAALHQLSERWLVPRLARGDRIFYVSARDALLARVGPQAPDPAALEASGLPAMERALERFLVTERGRLKLAAPRGAALAVLRELEHETIPQRAALLAAPLAELEAHIETQRPRLAELQRQRQRLVRDLERRRDALQRQLSLILERFALHLDERVDAAAAEVAAGWLDATFNRSRTRERIIAWLREWLEKESQRLETEELLPLLERETAEMMEELEDRLGAFLVDLDEVRAAFARPVEFTVEEPPPPDELPPALERVLGAVGGFLVGGVGGAIEGATHGWRSLISGIPVYVSTVLALALMGVTGPVGIGIVTAVGAVRTWMTGRDAAERLRQEIVQAVVAATRAHMPSVRAEVAAKTDERFATLISGVDAGMGALVDEVQSALDQALHERQAGEQSLAAAQARLAETGRALQALRERLAAEPA